MKIHIVKKGDTMYELSKKYHLPLQQLIEANPQIVNPDQLNVGDKVKIPSTSVPIGGNAEGTYVVKPGDTLWELSKAWGVSVESIVAANPLITNPDELKVGLLVNIPEKAHHSGGKKNTAPKPKIEALQEESVKLIPIEKEAPKPVPIQVEIGVEQQITYTPAKPTKPTKPAEPAKQENIQPFENVVVPDNVSPEFMQMPNYIAPLQQSAPAQLTPKSPCGCHDMSPYYFTPQMPMEMGGYPYAPHHGYVQPYSTQPLIHGMNTMSEMASVYGYPNMMSNMPPNMPPNMLPNMTANVQPYAYDNMQPIMQSNISPNVQPNMMPYSNMNTQPYAMPNMSPHTPMNVQPYFQPGSLPQIQSSVPESPLGAFGIRELGQEGNGVDSRNSAKAKGSKARTGAKGNKKDVKVSAATSTQSKNRRKKATAANRKQSNRRELWLK